MALFRQICSRAFGGQQVLLESLDKKWDSLKEEIDNINENDIPSFNNELWKSGIGALN